MRVWNTALYGLCGVALGFGLYPTDVFAQSGVYAFPKGDQSQQQQQQDHSQCHEWAVSRTGVNPNRPPTVHTYGYSSAPSQGGYFGQGQTGQGGVVHDAAGGAALGAIGGAIAGNAGKGAAIGALSATLFGGIRRSSRQQQEAEWQRQQQMETQRQQQEAQMQWESQLQQYRQAYAACMSAKNYAIQ